MEVAQLKTLAGRVRALLQQTSPTLGHNQALDLIAALPGLRNWPEVMAFPDRVAACELDPSSVGRLAFRLKSKFAFEVTTHDLLASFSSQLSMRPGQSLQVWPAGPPSGVYVTTSQKAIDALVVKYEEATDGGLVYAERAGSKGDGYIDLGESGLWSPGIERLPSGTLLVVGPIELDQRSWEEAGQRLEMSCWHALNSQHRVAILIDTPTPDTLRDDLVTLVRSAVEQPHDADSALVGIVSDDGHLQLQQPFAHGYPRPISTSAAADLNAFPVAVRDLIRNELAKSHSGIVLFGSSDFSQPYDRVSAALAMSQHAGPAARIMVRHRGTPEKDWAVPDPIKALPFLPSVASAYAQGYRRMVIDTHYAEGDALDYDDVLFLGCALGHPVTDMAWSATSSAGKRDAILLNRIIAMHGLLSIKSKRGSIVVDDLFLRSALRGPMESNDERLREFLMANRVIRWEDEVISLLERGVITEAAFKKTRMAQSPLLDDFFALRRAGRKSAKGKESPTPIG